MAWVTDSSIQTVSFEKFSPMRSSNKDVSSKVTLNNQEIEKKALVKKDGTQGTTTTTATVLFKDQGSGISYQSEMIPFKIEEGLYLGSVLASRNKDGLKELNITHILTVSHIMSPLYPNDFTYKTIKVVDTPRAEIAKHFGECFNFIDEAKSMGGGVLVHCNMAISRSPTIVIAYLMKKHAMSLKEALRQVQTTRSIVQPNHGFILQLRNLEKSLKSFSSMTLTSKDIKEKASVTKDTTETKTKRVHFKNGSFVEFAASEKIPTKIEEGLYLGSLVATLNKDRLKKLNVTHILTVRASKTPAYPDFTYKKISIPDTEDTNIAQYFEECFDYIENARSMGGGVLVHCFMGMSRSASIVIAYLMKKHGTSFLETLDQVKTKRPIVKPNKGFSYQLQQYEKSLIRKRKDGES